MILTFNLYPPGDPPSSIIYYDGIDGRGPPGHSNGSFVLIKWLIINDTMQNASNIGLCSKYCPQILLRLFCVESTLTLSNNGPLIQRLREGVWSVLEVDVDLVDWGFAVFASRATLLKNAGCTQVVVAKILLSFSPLCLTEMTSNWYPGDSTRIS